MEVRRVGAGEFPWEERSIPVQKKRPVLVRTMMCTVESAEKVEMADWKAEIMVEVRMLPLEGLFRVIVPTEFSREIRMWSESVVGRGGESGGVSGRFA
jgi:hypothetical protein